MKTNVRILILIMFTLALLAFPSSALAKGLADDQVVAGGNYTLARGETQDGAVLVFGGNADIQQGATVNGDVLLFGSNLKLDGTVNGTVINFGGNASLGAATVISGDLVSFGGNLNRDPGAQISGQVITETEFPLQIEIPSLELIIPEFFRGGQDVPAVPQVQTGFDAFVQLFMSVLWFLVRVTITAALAVLVVLIFPQPSLRTSSAIARQPLMSFVVGLLTMIVAPIILVVLTITILLSPVALIGGVLLAAVVFFGWVSLGYFLGTQLMGLFRANWAPAVAAGIGTFVLSFIAWMVSGVVPCVGWILPWVLSLFGTGAVLITRVGTQTYSGADLGASGGSQLETASQ